MAVRFVVGRAGTGKTFHCLQSIRRELSQDPVDGPRLIFLVPEQAGLQMERAIVNLGIASASGKARHSPDLPPGNAGPEPGAAAAAHRAEVLSFRRLAFRILEQAGGAVHPALTEPARAMVLRHLVRQESPRLHFYRRVNGISGFIERLSATVSELIQENVAAEDLAETWGRGGKSDNRAVNPVSIGDPHRKAKLHDLSVIYGAYLAYLNSGLLDPSQHLQIARLLLPQCEWINGSHIWVDGFASFSEQETLTLLELLRRCDRADITMLVDPRLVDSAFSGAGAAVAVRLFGRPYETFARLQNRIREVGFELAPPLILAPPTPPRFKDGAALARIEERLFALPNAKTRPSSPHERSMDTDYRPGQGGDNTGDKLAEHDAPQSARGDVEFSTTSANAGGVETVELPSRRVEAEFAVSRVCAWVQDLMHPLRYRDVALIVRDLDPYHDLLSDALRTRNIPFFIDRRKPVAHHPLVELIRACISAAAEDVPLDSVRRMLKTDLIPLSMAQADEIENFLLARGIAGREKWESPWSVIARSSRRPDGPEEQHRRVAQTSRLNTARESLLKPLRPWLDAAGRTLKHTGSAWSAALIDLLERFNIRQCMARWVYEAEQCGELEQADEHQQAWQSVVSVLDDLSFALRDVDLSVDELADVVEAGLSSLTLGLVPPTVDQVLVGSIERSRHPDIKAAIILGFNDGTFPKRLTEDSILNDDDRAALRDSGLRVGPGARERTFDESLLLYIAATRPSEKLVVTYAAADDAGKTLRPSPYLDALRAACPGLKHRSLGHPVRERTAWDVQCTADLRRRLTGEFRTRPENKSDDAPVRTFWNTVYSNERERMRSDATSAMAVRSLDEPRIEARNEDGSDGTRRLSEPILRRVLGDALKTSITQLESYAACPFQYFAKYVLRLRERAEAVLEPVDLGTVDHAIMEDFTRGLVATGRAFGQLSEEQLAEGLLASFRRVGASIGEEGLLDARNAFALRRSAQRLSRIVHAQRRLASSGRVRPTAAELPFGSGDPGGLPPVEIKTPSGRTVLLGGVIDRVDLVAGEPDAPGIVVDYKRSREKKLDMTRVFHGLSLQLPAYLLALSESRRADSGDRVRPGAALFVSLSLKYRSVDHPDKLSPRDALLGGTLRPRGLISDEIADKLDANNQGWSQNYQLYRNKDGGFGHTDASDVASRAEFEGVLAHARRKIGELADAILSGDVRVSPCRIAHWRPCGWCEMSSVCRVELGLSESRFAEPMKRSDALQKMTANK